MATASIKVTGNTSEAIAALERLGIKAEEVGKQTEHGLGEAAHRTGGIFQNLGAMAGSWGLPIQDMLGRVGEKFAEADTKGQKFTGALAEVGKVAVLGIGAGAAVAGSAAVRMGMDFEEATTKLVTGAGESEENLKTVREGLIKMAPAVGMGPKALADAMFLVESAGYHGSDGLKVMQAAAEGAKIGGADATTVANGLTTALTDYHLPTSQAAAVTSQLVATVAAGKTNMQDLSGSLSAVLPAASAAHVGLGQVLGALGTMTGEGISAQQASQNLASTISSLQNPSDVASKAMAQMGLNSTTVAQQLGSKGLTGTLQELTQHILQHMGPAGLVLESSFNQSKLAAQSANEMLHQLPKSLQGLAQGYLDGTVTQKEWTHALKDQPALVSSLGKQFATTAKDANGFADRLKSGKGDAATFNATLSEMTGGQTGLNTALALSGGNMATFAANTKTISGATTEAGGHVKGWAETQNDLKTKLDQARATVEALGTSLGMALIPKVTEAISAVQSAVSWFGQHKVVAEALAGVVGGVLAAAVGAFAINTVAKLVSGVVEAGKSLVSLGGKALEVGQSFVKAGAKVASFVAENAARVGSLVADGARWVAANAQQVASVIADGARWVASHAAQVASAIADNARQVAAMIARGAEWVAVHAVQTAVTIAQYVAQAAAATAAFIAENAATLGIIAAIGLLVAAAIYVGTHWSQVWGDIQAVAKAAWGYLSPIFSFIGNAIKTFVSDEITGAQIIWSAAWNAVQSAVSDVWGFLQPIFSAIGNGIKTGIQDEIQGFENIWNGVWSGIQSAVSAAWNFLQPILSRIGSAVSSVTSAVSSVTSAVGSVGSAAGGILSHIPGFAAGGVTPANRMFMVGEHGPELMISNTTNAVIPNSMLRSVMSPIGGPAPAAAGGAGGRGPLISIGQFIAGSQSPDDIASGLAFEVRGLGG